MTASTSSVGGDKAVRLSNVNSASETDSTLAVLTQTWHKQLKRAKEQNGENLDVSLTFNEASHSGWERSLITCEPFLRSLGKPG